MSRAHVSILLGTLVLGLPAAASANEFTGARFEIDESEARITVEAKESLEEPRFRTQPGAIRVWFPNMADDAFLDPAVDGRAVRWIKVRPGAGGTHVVWIRLGDRRTVPEERIRIDRIGDSAVIRIPREALPAPAVSEPAEAAPTEDVTESSETRMAEAETDGVPGDEDAEEALAISPPIPEEGTSESTYTQAGMADSGPSMGLLLLVTAFLGIIYLAVRLLMGKRGKRMETRLDEIRVVSSKRLGARHQLVLVRALGEDHLLSIIGNQAQRIASMPSPGAEEDDAAEAPAPRSEGSRIARLSAIAKMREHIGSVPDGGDDVPTSPKKDERPEFGAELLKFALKNTGGDSRRASSTPANAPQSEAVAGLLRLRRQMAD